MHLEVRIEIRERYREQEDIRDPSHTRELLRCSRVRVPRPGSGDEM